MTRLAEPISAFAHVNERRQARFRWELQQLLRESRQGASPLIINGRPQPEFRQRLALLLERYRLYREALDAHKLIHRATNWTIDPDRISWSIERHPLDVVLLQTWAIEIRTGALIKIRETYVGLQRSARHRRCTAGP